MKTKKASDKKAKGKKKSASSAKKGGTSKRKRSYSMKPAPRSAVKIVLTTALVFLVMFVGAAMIMKKGLIPADITIPGGKTYSLTEPETSSSTPGDENNTVPEAYTRELENSSNTTSDNRRTTETAVMSRKNKNSLLIIIDDVGNNIYQLEPFLDIPGPVIFAVLPGLPYTREAAALADKHGKEVIIHQPMEAFSGQNPGPGAIYISMNVNSIEDVLLENIDELPMAIGMNNHMGSAVTSDRKIMDVVLNTLDGRGLFFIDSLTTSDSVVQDAVADAGMPYIARDVFLDNERDEEYYSEAFQHGARIARDEGLAVLIGHVWAEGLADFLKKEYDNSVKEGISFISLAELPVIKLGYADFGNRNILR